MRLNTSYNIQFRGLKIVEAVEKEPSFVNASSSVDEVFKMIVDRFETLGQVQSALKKVGMKQCGLIFGMLLKCWD